MKRYCREHEAFINQALKSKNTKTNWSNLLLLHHKRLKFLQHERLIHLLVLLSFSTFSLLTVLILLLVNRLEIMLLAVIFIITSITYVSHYYYLENTTQRWYKLSDEIEKKIRK
jgi:hypothetical protein